MEKGGGGIAAIAVDCSGGVGKQHLLGAPGRRGKERQGKGSAAARVPLRQQLATCWDLFPARGTQLQRGRGDSSRGRAKEMTPGIQCWLQQRLVRRWWYHPPNNCGHPGVKRGDTDGKGNGNDASFLCG